MYSVVCDKSAALILDLEGGGVGGGGLGGGGVSPWALLKHHTYILYKEQRVA